MKSSEYIIWAVEPLFPPDGCVENWVFIVQEPVFRVGNVR